MAYNQNLPADTTAPEETRENFRALKEDKIVAADTANTASKLDTARIISLLGDATGSATFDGSSDVSISVDVISADIASECTGNAASATKLETARTINGVSFDGTSNVTITQVNGKDIATTDQLPVFDGNLSDSGYQKLPSGLIIQWGHGVVLTGTLTVNFPISFETECYTVVLNDEVASSWGSSNLTVYGASSRSKTGFAARALTWKGTSFANAPAGYFNYIAIGK